MCCLITLTQEGGNLGELLGRNQTQQLLALFLQVQAVRNNINNVRSVLDQDCGSCQRQFQTLNANLRRLNIIPGRRKIGNNNDENEEWAPAIESLLSTLRTLYLL